MDNYNEIGLDNNITLRSWERNTRANYRREPITATGAIMVGGWGAINVTSSPISTQTFSIATII